MIRYFDRIFRRGKKPKGKRVLIIDDNPDLRAALEALFEAKEYQVVQAGDGEQGLRKVKSSRPDIIILDVTMPKKNGLEVASELKNNPRYQSIPIIMLTAIDKMAGRTEEYWRKRSRADFYIAKPFNYVELVYMVERILKKHGRRRRID